MMENTKDGKEIRKPPPNYVGGNQNRRTGTQVVDLRSTDSSDCRKIWRRSRLHQIATEAQQGPRKCGFVREVGAGKNCCGGARFSLLRSDIRW